MTDQIVSGTQFDEVSRGLKLEDKGDKVYAEASLSQTYRTDVEDLWNAVSDPERIARWFGPVSGDLEVGGRFQVEGNAGGTIEKCERPRLIRATWEYGEAVSWIELALDAVDDSSSRLTLTHTGDIDRSFWDQFGPGATGIGWDMALLGLALHLESGQGRDGAEEWMMSEDGQAFIAGSSRRWADAAIAAGTSESEARAAADRTIAFYRGEEPTG